ncbi:Nitronate monooxygenase [Escovopsis weberi]|uniref:Nitronate monooxygenase n=1 Tax=Escovopsis weberi TaxID=150374 RepID=A0A0M8N5D4_ESCWE|nr:Nitronate monooxygenase [Escovopsis weberi]
MAFAASPQLAVEVTKARGLGFLASIFDMSPGSPQLDALDAELAACRALLCLPADSPLPIGMGILTVDASATHFAQTVLPLIRRHRPAALWLFAPRAALAPHAGIVRAVRALAEQGGGGAPRVFVQVGNATAAREALRDGADVLVCQGVDAGGHQFRSGMGAVALLREVRALLGGCEAGNGGDVAVGGSREEGRGVSVLAAGGIADGAGLAAAVTAGAEGVVLGTRFAVARESVYPEFRKQQILGARDGGSATLKSTFHDQIGNWRMFWGEAYDGRAMRGALHEKHLGGASLDECRRALSEDYDEEAAKRAINTWAGTAVGIINESQPAGEIVRQLRDEARRAIRRAAQLPWV